MIINYFHLFLSILAAIEIDRIIWNKIKKQQNSKAFVQEIRLPKDINILDILNDIEDEMERREKNEKK